MSKVEHRNGDWWIYEDPPWLEGRKYKPREKVMCPECGLKVYGTHLKNHVGSNKCKSLAYENELVERDLVRIKWLRQWEEAIKNAGVEVVEHNGFLWMPQWIAAIVQTLRRRYFLSDFLEEAIENIKDNEIAQNIIRKSKNDIVLILSYCDPERVVSLIINEKKIGYVGFYKWFDKIDKFIWYNEPLLNEIELLETKKIANRIAKMLFLLDKKRHIKRLNLTNKTKQKLEEALEQIDEIIREDDCAK